jgi:hypothetical protein
MVMQAYYAQKDARVLVRILETNSQLAENALSDSTDVPGIVDVERQKTKVETRKQTKANKFPALNRVAGESCVSQAA